MAEIELVIKIHAEQYKFLKEGIISINKVITHPALMADICERIANGTPLPKPFDLEVLKRMTEYTIQIYDMEDYNNARDNMTQNDIVNYLAYIQRGYVPDYNFTGNEDDFESYKLHMAISKAIEIIRNKAESED